MNAPENTFRRPRSDSTRFPRAEMLRAAKRIGALLGRLDRATEKLKDELEDGCLKAGLDRGAVLNIGHQVIDARLKIASRLHDFFNARCDAWARQTWSGYQQAASSSTPVESDQKRRREIAEVD